MLSVGKVGPGYAGYYESEVVAGDVADKVGDVAGDVADGAADGAGCLFRLLKRIGMVVLFPLWLVLMLFGCGPLS